MALQHNLDQTTIGIPLENVYTTITSISIVKQKIFSKPETEGGEAPLVSNHVLKIETETFVSQQAKEAGAAKIGFHSYSMPYEYENSVDALTAAYVWLKDNIAMFDNAIDV